MPFTALWHRIIHVFFVYKFICYFYALAIQPLRSRAVHTLEHANFLIQNLKHIHACIYSCLTIYDWMVYSTRSNTKVVAADGVWIDTIYTIICLGVLSDIYIYCDPINWLRIHTVECREKEAHGKLGLINNVNR